MRDSQGGRPSREVSPRVFTAAALAAAGGPPGAPDERTDTQTVGQAHGGHDPAQGARRGGVGGIPHLHTFPARPRLRVSCLHREGRAAGIARPGAAGSREERGGSAGRAEAPGGQAAQGPRRVHSSRARPVPRPGQDGPLPRGDPPPPPPQKGTRLAQPRASLPSKPPYEAVCLGGTPKKSWPMRSRYCGDRTRRSAARGSPAHPPPPRRPWPSPRCTWGPAAATAGTAHTAP